MTLRQLRPRAHQAHHCERCGFQREPLARVTATRGDGDQLTIRACDPCRKQLRSTSRQSA